MWPGARADEFHDLAGLVDLAVASGFRPVWIETANSDERDDFESGYQSDVEEWLAVHSDLRRPRRHVSVWTGTGRVG
jgi:hypothetical protein